MTGILDRINGMYRIAEQMKQGMDQMNFFKGSNRVAGSCLVALVMFFGVFALPVLAGDIVFVEVSLTSFRGDGDNASGHTLELDGVCFLSVMGNYGGTDSSSCSLEKGEEYELTISAFGGNGGMLSTNGGYKAYINPMTGLLLEDSSLLGNHEYDTSGGGSTTLYVPDIGFENYVFTPAIDEDQSTSTKILLECEPEECKDQLDLHWFYSGNIDDVNVVYNGLNCTVTLETNNFVFLTATCLGASVWTGKISYNGDGGPEEVELKELSKKLKWLQGTKEPIDTKTGNNYFTEKRLYAPSPGISLILDLDYKSVTKLPEGYLGKGWRHSYEWVLNTTSDYPAFLYTGDGEKLVFDRLEDGTYASLHSRSWNLKEYETGHELELPGGTTYRFNTNGFLSAVSDAWGNGVACSYGTNDCLESVLHSNGRQLTFSNSWNIVSNEWRVTSIQMQDGASLEFDYNADGQFTQIVERVDSDAFISSYQYADGFLTNKVNGMGAEFQYGYEADTNGVLTGKGTFLKVDRFYEHALDYVDDETTHVTYALRGQNQVYHYDYDGSLLANTYGPGTTLSNANRRGILYFYNADGSDITKEVLFDLDASASWTQWTAYDDAHNLTNSSIAYNSTTPVHQLSIEYDPVWNLPTAFIDAEGHRTETIYTNGLPLVVKAFWSDTQSHDTHFGYTTNGWLCAVTNANEHVSAFGYDIEGNLISSAPETGPSSTNTFDALGFLVSTETLSESGASTGRITQFDRDAKGRVLQTTYADSFTSTAAYNALGYLTNTVDRAGRTTDYTYAPTRQLTSITRYLHEGGSNVPVRISYDLDEQMNQLKIIEPRGRYVESYQFDIQDRVTSVTNIEGQVMTIDYGVGDFVQKTTRFDGTTITNEYDQAGRLNYVLYSSASVPLASVDYTYYPDGQQKSISDGTSTNTYSYDTLNRLSSVTSSVSSVTSVVDHHHDSVGNITNTVVSIGGAQATATSYEYDVSERLKKISRQGTAAQSFVHEYNPDNGALASITASSLTTTYGYDLMDRVTNITYKTASGTLIRSLGYEYNATSMITNKTIAGGVDNVSLSYQYDSIDRLVHESSFTNGHSLFDIHYSYDLAGNRLSKIEDGIQTTYPLGMGNRLASTNMLYISGTANEPIGLDNRWGTLSVSNLTSGASTIPFINGNSFFAELPALAGQTNTIKAAIRDRAGNTSYPTKDYWIETTSSTNIINHHAYNTAGCLTNLNGTALEWDERYRLLSVDDASSFVQYTYDVLNRRTSRTEGINVEHYVYDNNQVVADLDENGNLLRTYVWGIGIDNLLSMTTHPPQGSGLQPQTYYAIKDHQNTVIALADENGDIVETYDYNAYGRTKVYNASGTQLTASALGNRYTFQGREIDWTTGLYYFRTRWYNPETGRWLSKDTIGIAGGLNLYAFVDNNPANFIDPFGLCKPKPGDKFSIFKPKDEPYVTGGRDSDGFLGEKTALMHGVANIPFVHEVSQRHDRQIDALGVEGVSFHIMNVPLMVTATVETAVAGVWALVSSPF